MAALQMPQTSGASTGGLPTGQSRNKKTRRKLHLPGVEAGAGLGVQRLAAVDEVEGQGLDTLPAPQGLQQEVRPNDQQGGRCGAQNGSPGQQHAARGLRVRVKGTSSASVRLGVASGARVQCFLLGLRCAGWGLGG